MKLGEGESSMTYNSEAFRKVVERLSRMTAPQYKTLPITENTQVYGDLKIYGDEIVDLVWWLEKEFGVKAINIDPFEFAPHENPFFPIVRIIRKITGYEPQYKSLTVRNILNAIEIKRWPEGIASN